QSDFNFRIIGGQTHSTAHYRFAFSARYSSNRAAPAPCWTPLVLRLGASRCPAPEIHQAQLNLLMRSMLSAGRWLGCPLPCAIRLRGQRPDHVAVGEDSPKWVR